MVVENVVTEGNQASAPAVGGASDEMVTVSKESLRKVQLWLKRTQGRFNNHDLRLCISVISEMVDGRAADA